MGTAGLGASDADFAAEIENDLDAGFVPGLLASFGELPAAMLGH
jgi:hypothetical protein